MTLSPAWLQAILAARSIALIGASDDPTKISGRAMSYLRRYGYGGTVYPVNSHRDGVQGVVAYKSVAEVPEPVDVAVLSLPQRDVVPALRQCAEQGIVVAVVYASGFGESRRAGEPDLQAEITAIAQESGMRILGPNCLGAIGFAHGVTATFASALDDGDLPIGPIALVTQSGAFASFVFSAGRDAGLGFHFVANTGNEADLTVGEVLAEVIELPEVHLALTHIEGIRDMPSFERAARRARELDKPLVAVKVGRTQVGAEAARAHTGSIVGDDAYYSEVFARHGVVRAESMAELVDAGRVFADGRRTAGNRAAIVSISGGTGVLMADACIAMGMDVPELDGVIRDGLGELLPAYASTRNPVDLTGSALDNLSTFGGALDLCVDDEATDIVFVSIGNASSSEAAICDAILAVHARSDKPLIVTWAGGSGLPAKRLAADGVPVFDDPIRAIRAGSFLVGWSEAARRPGAARLHGAENVKNGVPA
ncbi:acetate--CoA ligase family protein [Rhodococcus sp. NPDC127530]|uniref:acetate--CoA ligase family protein n=1 Tax=unclassified Rhodococcus (in: high G+C Gram-positive bacteria) TaxID=192944 RepID=UPI0036410BA1